MSSANTSSGTSPRDPLVIVDETLDAIEHIRRYFLVNLTLMWDTVRDDLPDLEARLRILRRELDAVSEQSDPAGEGGSG